MKYKALSTLITSLISTLTIASDKTPPLVEVKEPTVIVQKLTKESKLPNKISNADNPFSNIKGMELLTYESDFEIWLHDQVFKTIQWCHSNKIVPLEKINEKWINAGTKAYGTWQKPDKSIGGIICNSIISKGISLKCNEPIKLFNKHSNIYINKYNPKTILAHKDDLQHDIKFVGKSNCSYNKVIDINTNYKATMLVEYHFDMLEEPILKEVTLKDGKTKEMAHSGKVKLIPSNPVMKETEREIILVPHE
jgi:hypothetical protein